MPPRSSSAAPVDDTPMRCVDAPCCTTKRNKTHKTDSAQVVYPWHPFYGREVTIHGQRNRRGTIIFICSIVSDQRTSPLEVPAWMFDTAVCCACRSVPAGRVTIDALRSLSRTLGAASYVIEAEHQSIAFGGFDAQTHEDSSDAARAVHDQFPDSAVTSGYRPENSNAPGPTPSSARKSKDGRERPAGG